MTMDPFPCFYRSVHRQLFSSYCRIGTRIILGSGARVGLTKAEHALDAIVVGT